jgi:1-acyl-sn-glycerol-3-phosphate acyltransferase
MCLARLTYGVLEVTFGGLWRRNHGEVCGVLPDEACILVCNHGSYLDWLLLDWLLLRKQRRNVTFLAKTKLLANPVWRLMIWYRRAILVDEREKLQGTAKIIRLFRNQGELKPLLVIFPEGTRSRSGKRLPASSGAAWLARKCGVHLVPVALWGFWQVWPPDRLLPSAGRRGLLVRFLDSIDLESIGDDEVATGVAMDLIYEVIGESRSSPGLMTKGVSQVL